MKKFKWWIIGAVILLCAAVVGARSCKITDDYSKLKGEYEAYRAVTDEAAKVAQAAIAAQEATIAEKDKDIAASKQAEADLRAKIGKKDAALEGLNSDLAAAKTDAERVPILTAMVETWREKYGVLEGVVAEKDRQLAAWGGKYAAAVTIGETWKAQYEAEHRLRLSGETLLSTLESKYRRARVTSSVKTVALVALAGAVGYQLIRGK